MDTFMKPEFFGADMYMFRVAGFRPGRGVITEPTKPAHGARLDVWRTDPRDRRRVPAPGSEGVLFSTMAFASPDGTSTPCWSTPTPVRHTTPPGATAAMASSTSWLTPVHSMTMSARTPAPVSPSE